MQASRMLNQPKPEQEVRIRCFQVLTLWCSAVKVKPPKGNKLLKTKENHKIQGEQKSSEHDV